MHFLQAINSDLSVLIVCNKTGGTIKGDKKYIYFVENKGNSDLLNKRHNAAIKFLQINVVSFSFASDMAVFLEYAVKHDCNITNKGRIFFLDAGRFRLTFRHRASCILGQAFHYSPENAFYIFNQQIYFII